MTAFLSQLESAKRFALLIVFMAALSGADSVQAAANARPLIELESHIEWGAVDGAWKTLRAGWVTKTTACDSNACIAGQLVVLEQHIEWKAVSPEWKNSRPSWVKRATAATTSAEVATLLLELEANVGWGAVDAKWKDIRPGWVAQVKGQ